MKSLRTLLFFIVGCFGPVEPPAPRCVVPDTTPPDMDSRGRDIPALIEEYTLAAGSLRAGEAR